MQRRTVAGLILLALALGIGLLPMRLALGLAGLSDRIEASSVRGTIWSARFTDASIGRLWLGTLHTRLAPLPLLAGTVAITAERIAAPGATQPLRATIERGLLGTAVNGASGELGLEGALGALPVRRALLDQVDIRFADGRCVQASGTVRLDIAQEVFGITLQQGLTGTLRCEGEALLLPLKGQSGLDSLDLKVTADGRYSGQLTLGGVDPALAARLAPLGFGGGGGDSLSLAVSGQF